MRVLEATLKQKKTRLESYYQREQTMLDPAAAKSYALGSRSISRYDTDLKAIQDMIKKLEGEIAELEAKLAGGCARKAVSVMPRDW